MTETEIVEKVRTAIAEKIRPAIDIRAPYAKVMLDMAAKAAIAAHIAGLAEMGYASVWCEEAGER